LARLLKRRPLIAAALDNPNFDYRHMAQKFCSKRPARSLYKLQRFDHSAIRWSTHGKPAPGEQQVLEEGAFSSIGRISSGDVETLKKPKRALKGVRFDGSEMGWNSRKWLRG
jgi:hypothetical protein